MQYPSTTKEVASQDVDRDGLYRRIAWRLVPLLIVCYIFNAIDRTNVGMAQLHLERDLGFSAAIYGIGIGVFYLGYVLFEVPSNLLLDRIGVRRTILRIMVAWGLLSSCTMFVQTPGQFYAVRFLLGLAEAGFYPGVLLYITYWFPTGYRARVVALFMIGSPIATIIGAPLSGVLMDGMEGVAGLYGWQWMFVLEGMPAVFLGIFAYFYLSDRPQSARWLSESEKAAIASDFEQEGANRPGGGGHRFSALFKDARIYLLGLVTLGSYTLASAAGFWTPLLLKNAGVTEALDIGLMTAIPPIFTIIAMNLFARHSDRKRERRWHFAIAQYVGAAGLILIALEGTSPPIVIIGACMTSAATYCAATVFINIASIYLSDNARAGGIALLTSIGAIASASAPMMMGWLRVQTGDYATGLSLSAVMVATCATVLLIAIPADRIREVAGR